MVRDIDDEMGRLHATWRTALQQASGPVGDHGQSDNAYQTYKTGLQQLPTRTLQALEKEQPPL